MSLIGKNIILTGGSRGIGRQIVLSLAEKGANVAFTYHTNEKMAQEVINQSENLSGNVKAYKIDIRVREEVKKFINAFISEKKTIDVVVSNAGIRKDKNILFLDNNEWDDVINTNLNGTFYLAQSALFHMIKKKNGRFIIISSISGLTGIAGQTNYSSSKAALFGFTRSLAKEVSPYGITVNAVAPGGVDTDMVNTLPEKEKQKLLHNIPLGRLCRPDEVAKVVLFLADKELSPDYLTGSIIVLDGGFGI